MSLSIFSLSILANNPEMDYFIELADNPFSRLTASLIFSSICISLYFWIRFNVLDTKEKIVAPFMIFLFFLFVESSSDYQNKTVHKMDVINSSYYQSLNDLDKSFVRISLMGDNADRFLNELPPMQDFNYQISLKRLDGLITQVKQNHLMNNGEKPKDENFIKNQELIKVLTHPYH